MANIDYLKGFLDGTMKVTGHIRDLIEQGEKESKELQDSFLKRTFKEAKRWKR